MNSRQFYVYILTNLTNQVLYIGVTRDLAKRTFEHKNKFVSGFTSKYNVNKLVYYEVLTDAYEAIKRGKQLKGGSRIKKISLINEFNPEWNDLYSDIL